MAVHCPNGATVESDCTQCPDGSAPSSHEEGNCNNPLTSTTTNTALNFSPNCDEPRPTGEMTFELIEQQKAWDLECGGGFTGGEVLNVSNKTELQTKTVLVASV